MALQGDLESFALPDVLRLLAGTAKSGRLIIEGADVSGELDLHDGEVTGGSTTAASRATEPADVVFELLRLDTGSFDFDDAVSPAVGDGVAVDDVLASAEQLVAEWAEVEKVVPSVDSWATLRPELGVDDVSVSAEQWRVISALGAGSSVRSLGERFEITDLAASQEVRGLIDAGLVELAGSAPEVGPDAEALDSSEAPEADSALLAAEDGPVILESRDDALLPEPLPGEGTSFAGDLDELASVDGRAFDPIEPPVEDLGQSDQQVVAASEPASGDQVPDGETAEADDADIWSSTDSVDPDADPITDETWAKAGWDENPPVDHLSEAEAGKGGRGDKGDKSPAAGSSEDPEGDRGSLLKFLSSVKN